MRIFSLFLLVTILWASCKKDTQEAVSCIDELPINQYSYRPEYRTILTPMIKDVYLPSCSIEMSEISDSLFQVSIEELCQLELRFLKILEYDSTQACPTGRQVKDIEKYVIQYLGTYVGGKKHIFVNGLLIPGVEEVTYYFPEWKYRQYFAADAGNWRAWFDLEQLAFVDLDFAHR